MPVLDLLPDMLTPGQAARRLGFSKTHVLRLADRGELGVCVKTKLGRLIPPDAVEDFARARSRARGDDRSA